MKYKILVDKEDEDLLPLFLCFQQRRRRVVQIKINGKVRNLHKVIGERIGMLDTLIMTL